MTYYHVSGQLKEGDQLLHIGKVAYDFCCYGSVCDLSTFDKYLECYRTLCLEQIHSKTGRTAGKWITEYLFEKVRREKYPCFPSRLWSTYLCDSSEESKKFLEKERAYEGSKIFEIEVSDKNKVYCFDMDVFTKAHQKIEGNPYSVDSYKEALDLADEYWKKASTDVKSKEYLIDDENLKVGKAIYCWSSPKT